MASDATVRTLAGWIIALCVVALAGTTAIVVSPAVRTMVGLGRGATPPAYAAGEQVDVDPAIYGTADRTVILFARSTCGVCQQGVPFYASLFGTGPEQGVALAMVTPSRDLATEGAFAGEMGLTANQVHHAASGSIRLRAVPTLMVVDRAGTILHVWFGHADAATQAEIQSVLTRSSARHP